MPLRLVRVPDDELARLARESGPRSVAARMIEDLRRRRAKDYQVYAFRAGSYYFTGPVPDALTELGRNVDTQGGDGRRFGFAPEADASRSCRSAGDPLITELLAAAQRMGKDVPICSNIRARSHVVFIQPATARPISSGESSWTKWTPRTVTSVCAGSLRARS